MVNELGKIALRREGKWWTAHWQADDHNVELARVRMNLAEGDERVKKAFIDFAMTAFASAVKSSGAGEILKWNDPVPAPEAERSGNA